MPTNILRRRNTPTVGKRELAGIPAVDFVVEIKVGTVRMKANILDTPTARRIWQALPIYSTAETWGAAVHFETPVESGRERGARQLVQPGDICFWSERDRVIIAYGPTPIAKAGEIRMPSPCNVWARTEDDVALLNTVVPGETVSITAAQD